MKQPSLTSKLFGNKGYVSQALFEKLNEQGLELIAKCRENMTNRLISFINKVFSKRAPLVGCIKRIFPMTRNVTFNPVSYSFRETLLSFQIRAPQIRSPLEIIFD